MNRGASGGFELYFPDRDRVFHWVRNSSLYTPVASEKQISVRALFRHEEIGEATPIFDRFDTGFYFRKLHSLCLSAMVPDLVDLDDLFWGLTVFSGLSRTPAWYRLAFPESLISGSAVITVSTSELKE